MLCSAKLCARLLLVSVLLGIIASASAQTNPCDIPPGIYRTYTMGGWGADCHGNNAGCVRDDNFATAFPSGLTVGGTFTIHFSSPAAINVFLPSGGTAGVLSSNHTDPVATEAGVFAGQVTALALSIGFADAAVPGFTNLRPLVIPVGLYDPYGPFANWTVEQIFDLANQVLGGNLSALPDGILLSDLNDVVNMINNNFDNGTVSRDWLVEPECDEILPVEIVTFTATVAGDRVLLRWNTAAESDVSYYEIDRREELSDWAALAIVNSFGNSATGFSYEYADNQVWRGHNYTYRLTVHSLDGSSRVCPTQVSAGIGGELVPTEFALLQNYPNPFNPGTTIGFSLPLTSKVWLMVYDVTGREVAELANREFAAGSHHVWFDAHGLPAGIYFYRIQAGSFSAVRKLMLVK